MKIFIDTADINEITQAAQMGIIDGVTTNPSLISKMNAPFKEIISRIAEIVDGPISAEVISLEYEGMLAEAHDLANIHENIVIKLPFGKAGVRACHTLEREGIRTNVTLIFSANQALLACQAGASFISPFAGRLDDIGHNGIETVFECVEITDAGGYATQVIAASIRNPLQVSTLAKGGAHIATLPFKIIEQMYQHPLTDAGIQKFMDDWNSKKS
jgi:transaldolase